MIDLVLTSIAFGIGILSAFLAFYYLWKDDQKPSKMTDDVNRSQKMPKSKGDAGNEIILAE